MDFTNFMQEAELLIKNKKKAELQEAMNNILRLLPEKQREPALKILGKPFHLSIEKVDDYHAWLDQVEAMDYHFEWELNEDYQLYSSWYQDDEDELVYYDSNNLLLKFTEILNYADELLNEGFYRVAFRLYTRIFEMELIAYNGDMGDYNEVDLSGLLEEKELGDNLRQHALNLLYAACIIYRGKERLHLIYHYYWDDIFYGIGLDEILAVAPTPIEDWDDLVDEWVYYLQGFDSLRDQYLMLEALLISPVYKDNAAFYQLVVDAHKNHPKLVLEYFDKLVKSDKLAAVNFAMEGLELLKSNSEVAYAFASEIIKFVKHNEFDLDVKKEILNRVFFVVPAEKNLLSLLNLGLTIKEHEEVVSFVKHEVPATDSLALSFFLRDFDMLYEVFLNNNQFLGWRQKDVGLIIPLFILLLMNHHNISTGQSIMENEVYGRLGYNDSDEFSEDFENWKDSVVLNEEQIEKLLLWLQEQVEKRGQEVIKTKYRNQYRRMAGLIVAIGEALEANGQEGARSRLIDQYYKTYYRARNFRAELESMR